MDSMKKILFAFTLLLVSTLFFGCGDNETNAPAIPLTASAVTSQADSSAHTHIVTIPFTDFSAAPATDIHQYRSDTVNGHSHVIALTKQQMIEINNGMRVILTSSSPDIGTDHAHTWSLQGGDLLYEKYCYNCHSYDKRGQNPMNVSFNSDQTGAVKNPIGAPLSKSAAAIPDPTYAPSTDVNLDGVSLYMANCASCHGALATSTKPNRTFVQIKSAITNNIGGMGSLGSLSDAQLQAVANALVK